MATLTVREALLRIQGLIEKGWTRKRNVKMRYGRPCYCISGAYAVVTKGQSIEVASRVWGAIRAVTPFYGSPIDFNDAPGRKKEEVVRLLQRAAAKVA